MASPAAAGNLRSPAAASVTSSLSVSLADDTWQHIGLTSPARIAEHHSTPGSSVAGTPTLTVKLEKPTSESEDSDPSSAPTAQPSTGLVRHNSEGGLATALPALADRPLPALPDKAGSESPSASAARLRSRTPEPLPALRSGSRGGPLPQVSPSPTLPLEAVRRATGSLTRPPLDDLLRPDAPAAGPPGPAAPPSHHLAPLPGQAPRSPSAPPAITPPQRSAAPGPAPPPQRSAAPGPAPTAPAGAGAEGAEGAKEPQTPSSVSSSAARRSSRGAAASSSSEDEAAAGDAIKGPRPRPLLEVLESGRLRVRAATWNLGGNAAPEAAELAQLLPRGHDLYAVASQECERSVRGAGGRAGGAGARRVRGAGQMTTSVVFRSKKSFTGKVSAALGPAYLHVASEDLMAIHISLFLRKDLLPFLAGVQTGRVATGIGQVVGNKGGVAVACRVFRTWLCFVSSHLAAHQKQVAQRNADFAKINGEMPLFPVALKSATSTVSAPAALSDQGGSLHGAPSPPHAVPPLATGGPHAHPHGVHPPHTHTHAAPDAHAHAHAHAHEGHAHGGPHAVAHAQRSVAERLPSGGAHGGHGNRVHPQAAEGDGSPRAALHRSKTSASPLGGDPRRVSPELPREPAPRGSPGQGTLAGRFPVTVWMGDLNYRINGTRRMVDHLVEQFGGIGREVLLGNDQLTAERRAGRAFGGFREGEIRFRPTYKLDPGGDAYDTSAKARIPAYTDRILFTDPARPAPAGPATPPPRPAPSPAPTSASGASLAAGEGEEPEHLAGLFEPLRPEGQGRPPGPAAGVEVLEYGSCPGLRQSDHRPVFATLLVPVELDPAAAAVLLHLRAQPARKSSRKHRWQSAATKARPAAVSRLCAIM